MNTHDFHDDLSAYMDNELEPNRREEVEAALAESAELRDELDRLRRVDALFQAAAVPDCPDELAGAVLDAIDNLPRTARGTVRLHRSRHLARRTVTAQLAAAAVLLLSGIGMVAYLRTAPSQPGRMPAEAFIAMHDKAAPAEPSRAPHAGVPMPEGGDGGAVYPLRLLEATAAAPGGGDFEAEAASPAVETYADADHDGAGDGAGAVDGAAPATGGGAVSAAAIPAAADSSPQEAGRGARVLTVPAPERAKSVGRRNDLGMTAPSPAQVPATPSPASPVPVPAVAGNGLRDLPSPVAPGGRPVAAGQGALPPSPPPPPPPQQVVLGGRVFLPRPAGWVEAGYRNEKTSAIGRDSGAWKELVAAEAALAGVAGLAGEIVFQSGGEWYRLGGDSPR